MERQRPRLRAPDTGRWGLAHGVRTAHSLCGALQAGAGSPRSTGIPGPLTSTPMMPPPRRCPCPGGPTSSLPYPHSGSQTPHGQPAVRSGSLPVAPSSQLCRPLHPARFPRCRASSEAVGAGPSSAPGPVQEMRGPHGRSGLSSGSPAACCSHPGSAAGGPRLLAWALRTDAWPQGEGKLQAAEHRERPGKEGKEAQQDPPRTQGTNSRPLRQPGYSRKGPGSESWLKGYNLGSFL